MAVKALEKYVLASSENLTLSFSTFTSHIAIFSTKLACTQYYYVQFIGGQRVIIKEGELASSKKHTKMAIKITLIYAFQFLS